MNCEVNSFEYNELSILRSTRQKNWLSIPSSTNQVIFQFKISKITGEKQLVVVNGSTMGKSLEQQSFSSERSSGMISFVYTPEEFSEDVTTQIIETTENGNRLKLKVHILNGDEVPEQLMI